MGHPWLLMTCYCPKFLKKINISPPKFLQSYQVNDMYNLKEHLLIEFKVINIHFFTFWNWISMLLGIQTWQDGIFKTRSAITLCIICHLYPTNSAHKHHFSVYIKHAVFILKCCQLSSQSSIMGLKVMNETYRLT